MAVMHFPDAVDQHRKWLEKLTASLRGERNELPEYEIICDDKCMIGQWLYGDGIVFDQLPEFQMVRKHHKDLHDIAAEAWTQKNKGSLNDPEVFLCKIKDAGHHLFMSWNELNLQIGALD